MPVTVTDVLDGVLDQLASAFPKTTFYTDEIKQEFDAPAFFIALQPVKQEHLLGRRYSREHAILVHYYPNPVGLDQPIQINRYLHEVAEKLYHHLRYIPLPHGLASGRGLESDIVDGVLHFFVTYTIHVMSQAEEKPVMQSMEQEGILK